MLFPACRHAEGTISSSSVLDVWRMASEDSDELVSGLPSVHRLCDLRDLDKTGRRKMPAALDEANAGRELLEVSLLGRDHREVVKERNDDFDQVIPPVDDVLSQVLPVVVGAPVNGDAAHAKEAE
jgi:hypothetical protein